MTNNDSNQKTTVMKDRKVILSTLWIFVTVNYIFCDVLSTIESGFFNDLMTGAEVFNQEFLLGAAILMEIPFAMIILSRLLKYKVNRWANIITGIIMIVVQFLSFFIGGPPTLHYIFFSIIEIAGLLFIIWYAMRWQNQAA